MGGFNHQPEEANLTFVGEKNTSPPKKHKGRGKEVISRKQKTIGDVVFFSICLVDPGMNWKIVANLCLLFSFE